LFKPLFDGVRVAARRGGIQMFTRVVGTANYLLVKGLLSNLLSKNGIVSFWLGNKYFAKGAR